MPRRPSLSELLAWTLVGAVVGVAAGFAAAEWLGPAAKRRARAAGGEDGDDGLPALRPGEATRAARLTLGADPDLAPLDLEVLAAGPGIVELHGWVPERRLRARAVRLLAGTPGIHTVINCLLVHGEDDAELSLSDATDLPA